MTTTTDRQDQIMPTAIEREFPIDGPHTCDRVIAAAEAMGHLARYLAHATLPATATGSLTYATDVDVVLGCLRAAVRSSAQVLGQIAARLEAIGADPGLRVDELGEPAQPAVLAHRAGQAARLAAGNLAWVADDDLARATGATTRLYHAGTDREA